MSLITPIAIHGANSKFQGDIVKKYAFVGTHGAGKTTLVHALRDRFLRDFPEKKIEVVDEVARSCPFPISDKESGPQGRTNTYVWITCEQLQKEMEAGFKAPDYILCDRSVLDPQMYYNGEIDRFFSDLQDVADSWTRAQYAKIFVLYTEPEMRIIDDNRRCLDTSFRDDVNIKFVNYFSDEVLPQEIIFAIPSSELFSEEGQKLVDKIYAECFLGL